MKRIVLIILLVICSGLFSVSRGQTAVDPSKAQHIRRLMEVMGAHNLAHQMIDHMMEMIKKDMPVDEPEVNEKIFNIYKEEFHKAFNAERVDGYIIPIYDKYFTGDELIALIAFYESPVGKKMIGAMPQILSEVSVAGEQISREVHERASQRITIEVKPAQKKAPNSRPAARRRPGRRP